MKRNLLLGVVIVLIGLYMSGCSAKMATQQPDKKNVDLFKIGTERSMILAKFGMPIASEKRSGKKYEIFTFTQGYSTGVKAGRALFHGAADVVMDYGKLSELRLKELLTGPKWPTKSAMMMISGLIVLIF